MEYSPGLAGCGLRTRECVVCTVRLLVLAAVLVLLVSPAEGYRPYPDPGIDIPFSQRFCLRRPDPQCCPGRDDFCTAPILETVCYCDHFCNRTVSDCCPDFWQGCLGVEPPIGALTPPPLTSIINNCHFQGVLHQPGENIQANCNNCSCVDAVLKNEYNWKCTQKICLVREELLTHVNLGAFGWQARNYSQFWGLTLAEGVRYRLGTIRPMSPVKQMTSLRVHLHEKLPESFDARVEWPGWIHPVMDQGNCGSSWAFSTTAVASDRLTIHSKGVLKDTLSPQHLLSCDRDYLQKGCEGGHIDRAWWYMRNIGTVSDACYPYVSGTTNDRGICRLSRFYSALSKANCPGNPSMKSRIYKATPPYRIAPHEREIMKEILENGPVQATMEVKEDFFVYRGGVYRYSLPATMLPPNHMITGFHSVKILGWGVDYSGDKPLNYWLCANSWGSDWGEEGYFRILRGADECKIESFVVGVWGKVNGRQVTARGGAENSRGRRHSERDRRKHHGALNHRTQGHRQHKRQARNKKNKKHPVG